MIYDFTDQLMIPPIIKAIVISSERSDEKSSAADRLEAEDLSNRSR
jgi:hypothetical protein